MLSTLSPFTMLITFISNLYLRLHEILKSKKKKKLNEERQRGTQRYLWLKWDFSWILKYKVT
jgi:hypothetical protein